MAAGSYSRSQYLKIEFLMLLTKMRFSVFNKSKGFSSITQVLNVGHLCFFQGWKYETFQRLLKNLVHSF